MVEPGIEISIFFLYFGAICFYKHSAPHVFFTGTELQHVAHYGNFHVLTR